MKICLIFIVKNDRYNLYKVCSVLGRADNIFGVNKTVLTDLLVHKMDVYTPENLVDLELIVTTIKGRTKLGKNQPKTALVRFEFIELFLRIAHNKSDKPSEPLKEILEIKLPAIAPIDPQEFRQSQYWNMECDNFMRAFYGLFTHLFEFKSSGQMTCDDFLAFLCEAKLIQEDFTERDAAIAFIQSKNIEADELDNVRHMKMGLTEFMEAVARVAWQTGTEKKLVDRLESLTTKLLEVARKDFAETYKKPEKTDGLFAIGNTLL